jgi:hypothetical protein
MTTFFEITHDYVQPDEWGKINQFLKENNVKWYAHETDMETGIQSSGYIVGDGVDLDKIKSYQWPKEIISVNVII